MKTTGQIVIKILTTLFMLAFLGGGFFTAATVSYVTCSENGITSLYCGTFSTVSAGIGLMLMILITMFRGE